MNALLDQLGLNQSFFIELAILSVLFFILSRIYFRPYLKLFKARYKKTVEDREAAERLSAQAHAKLEEYKRILAEERQSVRKGFDMALSEAKKQEAELLSQAREESKKITQDAADSANKQREQLRKQLDADVESVAQVIAEKLLSRKA